ncbi:Protein of unknown function [Gryllus bimaculatus]|nr:Protein of unknown function [Gryllus bimaculatus]
MSRPPSRNPDDYICLDRCNCPCVFLSSSSFKQGRFNKESPGLTKCGGSVGSKQLLHINQWKVYIAWIVIYTRGEKRLFCSGASCIK